MNPELKQLIAEVASTPNLTAEETDALMSRAYSLAASPEERCEAGRFLMECMSRRKRPDVDVRGILGDTAGMLNLSFIARCYFNKDRTWLYQRLNNSVVNGKPAAFTESELKILSDALLEIGQTICQTSVKLTH